MRILFTLLCSILLAIAAHAEPIYGVDYLAGKQYEKQMMASHERGWSGGIFLTTFGDAYSTVERMACSGKFSEIVVHIAPFDNSHAYPLKQLREQVKRHAPKLERIAKKCPQATLLPSPACEHNHRAKDYKPILDLTRKLAPSTLPVNTIWKGEVVYGYPTEIHLENSKARAPPRGEYLISFDGFGGDGSGDFTDADIPTILARYKTARQIRLWNFRFNGKFGHKDTTPIAQRKHWPSVEYIRGHIATMKVREGSVSWPKNVLYKTFADDHGEPSPTKDNKALAILPVKKNQVVVKDTKGNQIDVMRRVLPDHTGNPKGARYYSAKYAYQIANQARKRTGSSLIVIENLPPTDADLRSGLFR